MGQKRIGLFTLGTRAIGFGYALTVRGLILLSYAALLSSVGLLIARYPGPGAAVLGLGLITQVRRRGEATSGSYGTAQWASSRLLRRLGLLGRNGGLILGRADPVATSGIDKFRTVAFSPLGDSEAAVRRFFGPKNTGDLIRVPDFTHAVTVAPSGGGKGTACIIPNLLARPGSVVVHDPKGENFRITAEHRRRHFGHEIVHLNFWNVDGLPSSTFNPLDLIDPDARDAIDLCRAMGDALVERTGEERDPHFNDSASAFISSIIAWVAAHAEPGDRHLQTVREVLVSPAVTARAIQHMSTSNAMGGLLRRQAHGLSHYRDRELGSVMTTVGRSLQWLDSLAVAEHMRTSSFNPLALRRTGRMSIYITIPEKLLPTNRGLLRLIIGSLLKAITADGAKRHG